MANPFQSVLNWVAKTFQKDASKMLIITGVAGWALSSMAQISGILFNQKLSKDQKSFLIPQETADALVNITAFFLITQFTKKTVSKMFSTGKWAHTSVRDFLNKHEDLAKRVGKIDFDLDNVIKTTAEKFPKDEYYITKNFGTTVATIGAGILSSNIITPLVRNKMASKAQKVYKESSKPQLIENQDKPQTTEPTFKARPYYNMHSYYSGNMKI